MRISSSFSEYNKFKRKILWLILKLKFKAKFIFLKLEQGNIDIIFMGQREWI